MTDASDRLRKARTEAGYRFARDATDAFGFTYKTYNAHESGTRNFSKTTAQRYAKAFRVSPEWLLLGTGEMGVVMLPVVGRVGAGSRLGFEENGEKGSSLYEIEAPPGVGIGAVAVQVVGDSMLPVYEPGTVLIYSQHLPPKDMIGKRCVVRTSDGETWIKQVMPGSQHGLFNLLSANAEPIMDVEVDWAAPIDWIKPA